MSITRKRPQVAEFGDFQTPARLAARVCRALAESVPSPATIIEPTCGVGNLLFAAISAFPGAARALGLEINPSHVSKARLRAEGPGAMPPVELREADFLQTDWPSLLRSCAEPILVIGNPPWVTNSHLSRLGSANVPRKSNAQGLSGFEAISGKSNFDISEWMMIRLLDGLNGRAATLAMLCKTSVARKVMAYVWKSRLEAQSARMYLIDAREDFGVSVGACLLVVTLAPLAHSESCAVYSDLLSRSPVGAIGYSDDSLIADADCFHRWRHLAGQERYRWRSGIKHDCSGVMELRRVGACYVNGFHEQVELEEELVFPLFKSSDLARGDLAKPRKYMLVTQRRVGDDTRTIERFAPRAWAYLQRHSDLLDRRGSSIYARQPRFAIFGVGDYSFAPWKVAVSGMYKELQFRIVAPYEGKPAVLDDTCYFLACDCEEEAAYLASALNSRPAQEFYSAFMFPDAKRPVTVELLRRLDLLALARTLGSEVRLQEFLSVRREERAPRGRHEAQGVLFGG